MLEPSIPDDTQHEPVAAPGASTKVCETCQAPGVPVRIEPRGEVVLCTACLGARLRRRLPWRRYTGLAVMVLLMVPALTLYVAVAADGADGLRSGTVPATRTFQETFQHGWGLLTTVSDVWASLAVIATIALALAASLAVIASHGEQLARRAETEPVPSLNDYASLSLLDTALTASTGIALLTAVLAFIQGIDATMDGRTGSALPALFHLILAAILVIEVGKLGAFPSFAERSRLLVKTTLERGVAGRHRLARETRPAQAARAVGIVLLVHVAGYLAVTWPAGSTALGASLAVVAVSLVSLALVACPAALYLRGGDRPTLVMTVLVGVFVGMFWVSILYTVARDMDAYPVNPWGVTLGAWSFAPLYLVITLGLIGTGPARSLAYFSIRLDDAVSLLDRAAQGRARERAGDAHTDEQAHQPPTQTPPRPVREQHPVGAPSRDDSQPYDHAGGTASAPSGTTPDLVPDGPLLVAAPASNQAPRPARPRPPSPGRDEPAATTEPVPDRATEA